MRDVCMNTSLVLNFGCREFISWCVPGQVQVIGAWMSAIVVWCLCTPETKLYFGWSSILCQCAFACGVHWRELSEWYYWCTSDFYGYLSMGVRLWDTSVIFLLHDWIVSLSSYVKNSCWPSGCADFEGLGKGIIVVSWPWGCQCNSGGWHASKVCDCTTLVNQSLRAEAENGPNHFLLSAELMSCWLPQTPWAMRV
jgi:hypothetical protein